MDFTLKIYRQLLETFKTAGYNFHTMEDFARNIHDTLEPDRRIVVLRHDVDRRPANSLETAKIEHSLEIPASYYFRIVKESFHPHIIEAIATLNHEIGYHYEDLALNDGDYDTAYTQFKTNLETFRQFYPVKTICMHGNPLSKWDNRLIWDKFNYKDDGIITEPYFDIDFEKVLYITDTGRRWDATSANVRDKVEGGSHFDCRFRGTQDIINALKKDNFPDAVIINSHPERWDDSFIPWFRQLVLQNAKNIVKKIIARKRSTGQPNAKK